MSQDFIHVGISPSGIVYRVYLDRVPADQLQDRIDSMKARLAEHWRRWEAKRAAEDHVAATPEEDKALAVLKKVKDMVARWAVSAPRRHHDFIAKAVSAKLPHPARTDVIDITSKRGTTKRFKIRRLALSTTRRTGKHFRIEELTWY